MRCAISSVIEDSGYDKRWDDEVIARSSRLNFAANEYMSIGYRGAQDKSTVYSGKPGRINCFGSRL